MAVALESNKTKIARRVIEVFEFFAAENRRATVMDIVRRYGRPQSSTSELLGSLVEMGLLYKDSQSRSYAPTPRLAALGFATQPEPIGNGRLFAFMDRLAQTSRCGVGLFGVVGTHAQVFRWSHGNGLAYEDCGSGTGVPLSSGAIGLLLLSALGMNQASRLLWRLHAEAPAGEHFDLAAVREQVARCGQCGHATGASGFAPGSLATALLLPKSFGERRMALGVIYDARAAVDPEALVTTLGSGVRRCLSDGAEAAAPMMRSMAAI
jgi:DNA-binding IclR family transcriptional regulator